MKQYEYKTLRQARQKTLNKLGLEGWDLISAEFVKSNWDKAARRYLSGWNCLMRREIPCENGVSEHEGGCLP